MTRKGTNKTKVIAGSVAAVVLALLLIAVVVTVGSDDGSVKSADGERKQFQDVTITGSVLPELPDGGGTDPAVGLDAPGVAGKSFDGGNVTIAANGRPKVVMFLAHWCPHCQREMPVLSKWLMDNRNTYNVDFYGVSTAVSEQRTNFPPSDWFEREQFDAPVIADDTQNRVAEAYGLTGYPYMVFIDKDNKVIARVATELSATQFTDYVRQIAS